MSDYLLEEHALSPGKIYRLLSGSICPRPIAWVSTLDAAGNANLAPFSFFNVVSVNPPVLGFSPLLDGDANPKDTIRNLGEVGECVVHISGEGLVTEMNATSAGLEHGDDEFIHAGLEKVAMAGVSVPRVAGAPVAFGCRLREIIRFGDQPLAGNLVLAEVVSIHIDDALWDGRHVDAEGLRPIGRMAGNDYARCTDLFEVERPASGSSLSAQQRGGRPS
ncbi:flavin reductase family protein [Halomonas alkalicola]|uniref:Flavin reductase family protein n=1 Tax=Halomonas alkalicola TaxID=1930622 RepID=A0ABY9H4X3_9GAMM|nr:flavin reductase family protein [Halomonas alkalicola]WLI72690.1 flavin reductase family protein [Halomonas alkalicola]